MALPVAVKKALNNIAGFPSKALFQLGNFLDAINPATWLEPSAKDPVFGAVGDGIADDTVAIQALLTYLKDTAETTGKKSRGYLPYGKYKVSKSSLGNFCLAAYSDTDWHGPGKLIVAPNQPFQCRVVAIENAKNVKISGITIDGNSQNQQPPEPDPKKMAIFIRGSSNVLLDNIRFENIDGDAIYCGTNNGPDPEAHDVIARNIWVEGCRRSGLTVTAGAKNITLDTATINGWSADQSGALNIESDGGPISTGCVFKNVNVGEPSVEFAHTAVAISVTRGHGLKVKDCVLPAAVFIVTSNDVEIDDNEIVHDGSSQDGRSAITFRYDCARPRATRNKISIHGPSEDPNLDIAAILVVNTNNATPSDAVIQDNYIDCYDGMYGVWVENLDEFTVIKGNTIDGHGTGRGIHAQTTSKKFDHLSIHENQIRNTGAGEAAISFSSQNEFGFKSTSVKNNKIIDTQNPPTCPNSISFHRSNNAAGFGVLELDGNTWTPNIGDINIIGGAVDYWVVGGNWDGTANTRADFEGVGVPAIPSKTGSTYRRRDGGAGTSFYVKESSDGSNNWVAK